MWKTKQCLVLLSETKVCKTVLPLTWAWEGIKGCYSKILIWMLSEGVKPDTSVSSGFEMDVLLEVLIKILDLRSILVNLGSS